MVVCVEGGLCTHSAEDVTIRFSTQETYYKLMNCTRCPLSFRAGVVGVYVVFIYAVLYTWIYGWDCVYGCSLCPGSAGA